MNIRHRSLLAGFCLLVLTASAGAAEGPKVKGEYQYSPGLDNTMLFLQGDVLIRLGADGVTEKERRQLGAKYVRIAERAKYFVALSDSPKAVVTLDKKTLKPIREQALTYPRLMDLTLHPKLPVSYVAVKFDIKAPSFRVIVFDEESGEAREPRGFFGTWVCVHPTGTYLVTGHKDIYQRGTNFFINPDWKLHSMPEYGNIDLLITYALDDKGMPTFMDLKSKAGGNGSGIRMSANGERVSYLSVVGTPMFSGNLGGFDPLDLQKLPVTYATKDRASTEDLAYHPSLPLCASPGQGSAVFFHQEKGTVEERLDKPVKFTKVHRVWFSPDGKNVVLDGELDGVRALRSLPLKLSPAEATLAGKGTGPVADNSAKVKAAMQRARREIDQKLDPVQAARDKAADWLKLNNVFGPDHKIVTDQLDVIDKEIAAGRNVHMIFGRSLMKSGLSTHMCIWNGVFIPLPLTAAQDKTYDFPKLTLVKQPANKAGWRLSEPKAQLSGLKIAKSDGLDGTQKITGTVQYNRLDAEPAYYALKIEYIVNGSLVTNYHQMGEYLIKSEGEIAFEFLPVFTDKRTHKGPLPVFVELVTFATPERRSGTAIASNTIGQIVVVKAP
ncbi:hypothetical protein [Zavarzinella formosa]|uniref:hypothetical protein n=1 Tax=Zavarzinella formosa TaxID=360055 RepID=UPI0012FAA99F|nr:hypothetical protein [Zavarzinella formosa]